MAAKGDSDLYGQTIVILGREFEMPEGPPTTDAEALEQIKFRADLEAHVGGLQQQLATVRKARREILVGIDHFYEAEKREEKRQPGPLEKLWIEQEKAEKRAAKEQAKKNQEGAKDAAEKAAGTAPGESNTTGGKKPTGKVVKKTPSKGKGSGGAKSTFPGPKGKTGS